MWRSPRSDRLPGLCGSGDGAAGGMGARAPGSARHPLPRAPAGPARPRPPPIAGARRLRAEARRGVGALELRGRGVARSPEGVWGRRVAWPGPTRGPLAAGGASSWSGRPTCMRCPRGRAAAAPCSPGTLELRILWGPRRGGCPSPVRGPCRVFQVCKQCRGP